MVSGLSIKERMYIVLRPTYGELVATKRMAFLYIGNDRTEGHYGRRRSVSATSKIGMLKLRDRHGSVRDEDGRSMVEQGES